MLRDQYVLGVDIGTTRTKGIILNSRANTVISASLAHSDIGISPGWHEHDPENTWWGEFVTIVRHLLRADMFSPADIECVCITGMFPCFCPADELGHPLYNAILHDDSRTVRVAKQLRNLNIPILEGNELLARLVWFSSTFPGMQSSFKRIYSTHSFVVYRLTGKYCIDSHTALMFGSVFEPATFSWKRSELQQIQINDDLLLPEVLPPLSIGGYITNTAAQQTGLCSGTPVLVGTGDIFASVVSSGARKAGDVVVHYGSVGHLLQLSQDTDYLLGAQSYKNGDDGLKLIVGLARSGKQLEWFSKLVSGPEQTTDPDPHYFLRYFNTAVNPSKPAEKQILFFHDTGYPNELTSVSMPLATFLAVPLGATAIDLYRAILEGFGYRIRQGAESSGLTNVQSPWYAVGGGTQSAAWCQIVTDIVDRVQTVCSDAESAIGAALIAGYAADVFDLQKVIERRIADAVSYRPQSGLRHFYDQQYSRYLQAFQFLQSFREQFL